MKPTLEYADETERKSAPFLDANEPSPASNDATSKRELFFRIAGKGGDAKACSPYGIPLLSGEAIVLPGLSNSFEIYEAAGWVRRNRYLVLFAAFTAFQSVVIGLHNKFSFLGNESEIDAIPITIDIGDLKAHVSSRPAIEYDEVFGNQFVKEKKDENYEDPRITGAVNPYQANLNSPVDQNPEIIPEYPPAARAAGLQGTVTLELVVSDEGEVLRAKPVGRKLGKGLEEAAAAAFRKKHYKPAIDRDGKAFTVKFFQPVRFVLN